MREAGVAEGADTRLVEDEICYVRRELRVRVDRREAHEKFVRSFPISNGDGRNVNQDAQGESN